MQAVGFHVSTVAVLIPPSPRKKGRHHRTKPPRIHEIIAIISLFASANVRDERVALLGWFKGRESAERRSNGTAGGRLSAAADCDREVSPDESPSYSFAAAVVHLFLTFLISVVGFFGGFYLYLAIASAAGSASARADTSRLAIGLLGVLFFPGGAFAGLYLAGWLARRTPARCPACGGDAYYHEGKPITYRCAPCGHVHRSIWSTRGPDRATRA